VGLIPATVPAVDPAPAVTVYVHPTCSKSRQARELLDGRGQPYQAVDYLTTVLGRDDLGRLLDRLGDHPSALVRVDDAGFAELGLTADDVRDRAGVLAVLGRHPELMQRPVVVRGERAVIARPPERLLDLF